MFKNSEMNKNKNIKSWAPEERPREKLLSGEGSTLSNAELLAILIHNGQGEKTALDLAREVLGLCNHNLNELGKLELKDFMKLKGIGASKAATLAAALELGRRRQMEAPLQKKLITQSTDLASFLQPHLQDLNHEVFGIVLLNQANKIIHWEIISKGGITGTVADPRMILRKTLDKAAVGLVLFHNHPSGNLNPSKADEQLTQKIKEGAAFMDIRVLDHLILSSKGYYSFADEGKI